MKVQSRVAVVACGAALSLASLTSVAPRSEASASTTGVTASAIDITYIYNDLSILTQEHLAPSDGNVLADVQDAVEYVNEHGGVGGRKIQFTSYKMPSISSSAAEDEAACLAAIEQDHAFIVYVGDAVDTEVAQCTAVNHKTLTFLAASGPAVQYFQQADGRLFMIGSGAAMDNDRQIKGWVDATEKAGALKGKEVGIIEASTPSIVQSVSDDLKPELANLGHAAAAVATVPLPQGASDCSQASSAVQVMKQAGVNLVFLAAYDLCGVAVVQAAEALDYRPQWTTNSDNVTNTVAMFYAPVKNWFNGALGVEAAGNGLTQVGIKCVNTEINPKEHYGQTTDAFGLAAQGCVTVEQVVKALKQASPNLTTSSFISAMNSQSVQPMNAGPPGTLSAHQHDAADYVQVLQYSASQGIFIRPKVIVVKVPCPCAP